VLLPGIRVISGILVFFSIGSFYPVISTFTAEEVSPNKLLRVVLNNELDAQAKDHSLWMYRMTSRVSGHERTKAVIENKDCDLEELLEIDGRPVPPAEQRKEDARIQKLLNNPQEQRKQREDQARDSQKAQHFLRILPDAVTASYSKQEADLTELNFAPNPKYRPSSHEEQVFHAMEGKIWLNTKENRLAEIDGHLLYTVKFAGGWLGHLDKGGSFQVKQTEVAPGHWEVTLLHVAMQGKALFFKTIAVQEDESYRDFQKVGDNLPIAQAAKQLREHFPQAVSK
jgi:hypothetical protein